MTANDPIRQILRRALGTGPVDKCPERTSEVQTPPRIPRPLPQETATRRGGEAERAWVGLAAGRPVQGQVSTRRKGGWGHWAGPRAGQSVGPREASADPHCAPTTSPSPRKGNSGPTGLGVGKGGERRALHKVSGGPFPQPVTRRRAKTRLRGRRPRVSGDYRPKRTRPTHWAPASPEDSGAAAPEDPWAAPAAAARREPRLSNPGPHLPRPGYSSGRRGRAARTPNRVASELPERPRAESSHLEAIQAAAPAAAGTSRLATPSSACGKKTGRGKACVRVT